MTHITPGDHLTIRQVANRLGLTFPQVDELCRANALVSRVLIDPASVAAYEESQR